MSDGVGCGRMGNTYYVAGEQRAERVRDLFGAIAPRYDFINDVQSFGLHRYWKRRLITLAQARPGMRGLDLCCGTGDVTLALARCGAFAVGVDFSWPMLAVAQRRDAHRVKWVRGDALRLPFPESHFDLVTISYGLRNLASYRCGLAEMRRVLKPGGTVAVLDFGKPENRIWRRIYFSYLRLGVPLFGRLFCGDAAAYAYILESLRHYPGQRELSRMLGELGFGEVRIEEFLGGVMSVVTGKRQG